MKLPFPERVLRQHAATLGKTGAGKSSAMRVIAEHLLDKNRRVAIVDPKGDWWGLKSSADGKSAGYPVITFGNFKEPRATDVPINEHSGAHVAELIAKGNRPCVIGFRGWMPSQLVKFWLAFAPTLFNANEGELNVFIDEVHNFAPKGKIFDPDAGKCLHWTNRIMSEGRGLGLTFFIASQRPQKVHNDTLDNCETLIAMRVAHPAAREALKDWIDGNGDPAKGKEVLSTLAQLKRGEAWVWSPENDFGPERVQFPMFQTFDSFAPPQLQKKVSESGWSEVDLDQVKQKLATVIAEAKANDPKELKAEISRLRSELAKAKPISAIATPVVQEKIVEVSTFSDAERMSLVRFSSEVEALLGRLNGIAFDFNSVKTLISSAMERAQKRPQLSPRPAPIPAPRTISRPSAVPRPAPVAQLNGDFSGPEQNILNQLAELEVLGIPEPEKPQLGLMAGYTNVRSGGFSEPMGRLVELGFACYPRPGFVALTDQGRNHAQAAGAPLNNKDLHDRLCQKLGGPEARLLREVISIYPDEIGKEELGARLGYTNVRSGGFSEPIGRLKSLGIIEYPQKGFVKAAEWLFLEVA